MPTPSPKKPTPTPEEFKLVLQATPEESADSSLDFLSAPTSRSKAASSKAAAPKPAASKAAAAIAKKPYSAAKKPTASAKKPRSLNPMLLWGAIGGSVGVMFLGVLIGVWINSGSSSRRAKAESLTLQIDWPENERDQWARINIDGKPETVREEGDIKLPLKNRSKPYEIVLERPSFEPQTFSIAANGEKNTETIKAVWKPLKDSPVKPDPSKPRTPAPKKPKKEVPKPTPTKPKPTDSSSTAAASFPSLARASFPSFAPSSFPSSAWERTADEPLSALRTKIYAQARPDAKRETVEPAPVDTDKLLATELDITFANGQTRAGVKILKHTRGKEKNSLTSITIPDGDANLPKLFGAVSIKEISLAGGRALWVYDPAKRLLVPPDQATKIRTAGKPASTAKTDAFGAEMTDEPREAGAGRWPMLSDAQQKTLVEKQREFLKDAESKVPSRGMKLYETKRFLFFSDLPPDLINSMFVPCLDQMYTLLCNAYGLDPKINIWRGKCIIVAYSSNESFLVFEQAYFPGHTVKAHTAGLAHVRSDGDVLISCHAYDKNSPASLGNTMVHETVHGFNHRYRSAAELPSWLNEGTAEWVADKAVPTCLNVRHKVEESIRRMQQTRVLGPGYFTADHIDFSQYGTAASMVDFLVRYNPKQKPAKPTSGSRRPAVQDSGAFRKFVQEIKDGTEWQESLQKTYGLTPESLAAAYGQAIGVPDLKP